VVNVFVTPAQIIIIIIIELVKIIIIIQLV